MLTRSASFSYSFFDTKAGFASLPSGGIEPIPRVLSDPIFNADLNSLDIVLSDFYYLDSAGKPEPLDIHLGPIGPLATRPWRSTAPSRHRFDRVQICEAVPFDDHAELSAANAPLSSFPSSLPHVLVVVQMPSPEQILRTMQECSAQVNPFEAHEDSGGATSRSRDDTSQGAIGVDAWLSGTNEGAREPDNSASHGPQTVIRALAEEQPDPSPAADMSDIATVLGVHAGSDFAFLASPSVDQALVDPALIAEPEAGGRSGTLSAPPLADVATGTSGPGADAVTEADNVDMSDQPVHLVARQRDGEKSEMVPLPLVLVRRSDGVGFGVGRSVEAERLNGDVDGKPQWGEWRTLCAAVIMLICRVEAGSKLDCKDNRSGNPYILFGRNWAAIVVESVVAVIASMLPPPGSDGTSVHSGMLVSRGGSLTFFPILLSTH